MSIKHPSISKERFGLSLPSALKSIKLTLTNKEFQIHIHTSLLSLPMTACLMAWKCLIYFQIQFTALTERPDTKSHEIYNKRDLNHPCRCDSVWESASLCCCLNLMLIREKCTSCFPGVCQSTRQFILGELLLKVMNEWNKS